MNGVFCAMLLLGMAAAAVSGNAPAAQSALLSGGEKAVEFGLSMAGTYALFGGLLGVLRESGVTDALARRMRRPLRALFSFAPGEERALDDICVNLAADMLGMGGAATPAGLSAMRRMAAAAPQDGTMSPAMELFLVLNMCSVQLLPSTMIGLRAAAGALNPADIILPTLFASSVSLAVAAGFCKLMEKRSKTDA